MSGKDEINTDIDEEDDLHLDGWFYSDDFKKSLREAAKTGCETEEAVEAKMEIVKLSIALLEACKLEKISEEKMLNFVSNLLPVNIWVEATNQRLKELEIVYYDGVVEIFKGAKARRKRLKINYGYNEETKEFIAFLGSVPLANQGIKESFIGHS